jgi:hypothetical protein
MQYDQKPGIQPWQVDLCRQPWKTKVIPACWTGAASARGTGMLSKLSIEPGQLHPTHRAGSISV